MKLLIKKNYSALYSWICAFLLIYLLFNVCLLIVQERMERTDLILINSLIGKIWSDGLESYLKSQIVYVLLNSLVIFSMC